MLELYEVSFSPCNVLLSTECNTSTFIAVTDVLCSKYPDFFCVAKVDEYGTQQPIALLKLLLEKGFLYDRGKEMNCKFLRDLGFVAAMGKAGGGRNEVDPRFISLFSVFNIPFPSEQSLNLIYASILKGHTAVMSP